MTTPASNRRKSLKGNLQETEEKSFSPNFASQCKAWLAFREEYLTKSITVLLVWASARRSGAVAWKKQQMRLKGWELKEKAI